MISPRLCPVCEKPLGPEVTSESGCFPFCSRRCQQIDLLRWSQGKYAIVEPLSPDQVMEQLDKEGGKELEGWEE
jgi:endogenous inhibitor of DNA gyrase (YacG/DUF329 family)